MRAAIYNGDGTSTVTTHPFPVLTRSSDVIVKVAGSGICGTDVHALTVPPHVRYRSPIVIGHEFVGTVEVAGQDSPYRPGDRVAVHPNIYCGVCWYCQEEMLSLCTNLNQLGITLDGGTAEFCAAPSTALHRLPDDLPFSRAVLAEPLSCVINGVRKASLEPGDTVAVLGGGPIGVMYAMVLKGAGSGHVVVSEPQAARREYALSLAADSVVDPTTEDLVEHVLAVTNGRGADIVIDTVGFMLADAMSAVRRGGRIMVFGLDKRPREVSLYNLMAKEITVRGVLDAADNLPRAIRLLADNHHGFERVITDRVPLEDFQAAVETSRSGVGLKSIVVPDAAELGPA